MRRLAAAAALLAWPAVASAGGYLLFDSAGAPVGWEPAAPLLFTTDRGALGALSQAQAEALVGTLTAPWEDIPTAAISYQRAGALDVDVTGANFGPYLGPFGSATTPLGKTVVVFDANGEIFGELFGQGTRVVGFASPTWASAGGGPPIAIDGVVPPGSKIVEGLVFLNGELIDGVEEPGNPEVSRAAFDDAIVHELGHLSGLGHTQVHGLDFPPETDTPGWTSPVETMFPLLHPLGGQGSPERDDVAALSRLYPAGGFGATTGCVAGRVLTSGGQPFTGANVVAWNLDDGADALSWVSGAALVDAGAYTICGLQPGARYRIEVQEIDSFFTAGSRVGPFSTPAILPGPPESWNGASESSDPELDPPAAFAPVQVAAGTTRGGVDLRLNRQPFDVLNHAWGLGPTPLDFAVGDFDRDGRQDFVGVQFGFDPGNIVTFSRGRGNGTFEPPVVIDDFPGNSSVVAGQLNAALDSNLDIAAASDSTREVRVYFGDGHGGFGPPQTLVPGHGIDGIATRLAAGDLNGDAFTDLAAFTRNPDTSGTVHALLGSGGGAFTTRVSQAPGAGSLIASEVIIGQLTGSSANDLLLLARAGFGGETPLLHLLIGDGTGRFTPTEVRLDAVSQGMGAPAVGDLNGDGKLDLVFADPRPVGAPHSFTRTWVSLLLGDGAGAFTLAHRYRVAESRQSALRIADFNRDGRQDVVSTGSSQSYGSPGAKVNLALGNGAGGVRELVAIWGIAEFSATSPSEMDLGDFDGDGKLDVLLSDGSSFYGITGFVPRFSVLLQRDLGGDVGPCIPGDQTLCLAGGRFRVEATWTTAQGSGPAHAVPLTADTGYLWFFGPSNVEVVVKVLDACTFNQRFWVFAGGLTDVGVTLRVTDTVSGEQRTYTNPQGVPFRPLQDTGAFATCP